MAPSCTKRQTKRLASKPEGGPRQKIHKCNGCFPKIRCASTRHIGPGGVPGGDHFDFSQRDFAPRHGGRTPISLQLLKIAASTTTKKEEASRRRAACRLAKNVRPSGYVAVMRRPGSDPVDAPFSATVSQPIDPYQSVVERIGHRLSPGLLAVTPMNSFVCPCPKTGLPVQGWNIDASRSIGVQPSSRTPTERQDAYQGEHCPVCARLHLVNPETGKLLGEGETSGPPGEPTRGRYDRPEPRSSHRF